MYDIEQNYVVLRKFEDGSPNALTLVHSKERAANNRICLHSPKANFGTIPFVSKLFGGHLRFEAVRLQIENHVPCRQNTKTKNVTYWKYLCLH